MRHQHCFACGQRNNKAKSVSREDRIILHSFPKDKKSADRWKKFCSLFIPIRENDEFRNVYICSQHFEISAYNNKESHLLKKGAYPKIYEGYTYVADDDSSDELPPADDLHPATDLAPSDVGNDLHTQIKSSEEQVPSTDDQGGYNPESKCRICFCQKPMNARKKVMDSFYKNYSTISGMLSLCVPQLENPILPNDWVCLECLEELCSCVKFVEKCMETDKMIGLDKALFDHDYTISTNCDENSFSNVWIKEEVHDVTANYDLGLSFNSNQDAMKCDVLPQSLLVKNNVNISETDNLLIPQSDSQITESEFEELLLAYQKTDKLNEVATCIKCGMVFYSDIMYRRHVNEFRELEDCMFVCRTCSCHYLEVHNCGKPGTTCSYCFKVFDDKETYNEHPKTHTPFSCELCTSYFSTQSQVNLHMLTHQLDSFEQCTGCENIYSKDKIENHLLKIHNPVTESAREVSKTTNNPISSDVKPKILKYKCPLCPEAFPTSGQKIRHVKCSEKHIKKFPCNICEEIFQKYVNFKEHLKSLHNYEIFCDKCLAKFDNEEGLKSHLEKFAAKSKSCGFSVCEKCDMRFWKTKTYETHMKLVDCKYRVCEVCNRKFSTNAGFLTHKHANQKYVCEKCGKSFNSATGLSNHRQNKSHASKEDFLICEYCGKSFTHIYYKRHLKDVHANLPKENLCIYCSKQFLNRADLKRHEKIHTRIRDAACIECGKHFFKKSTMERHYRAIHLKQKSYKCNECPLTFAYRKDQLKHMRNHKKARMQQKAISEHPAESKVLDQGVKRLDSENSPNMKKRKRRKINENRQTTDKRPQVLDQGVEGLDSKYSPNMKKKRRRRKIGENRKTKIKVQPDPLFRKNCELAGLIMPPTIPGCFVKCHFCGEIIKKVEGLKLHIRNRHAKIRRYKCHLCEMTFIFKVSLQKHAKQHEDPRYMYRCKICFRTLKSQEEFIKHSAKHKLPFECDICSQRFGRKYLLECHKDSVHPNPEEKAAKYREMVEIAFKNVIYVPIIKKSKLAVS